MNPALLGKLRLLAAFELFAALGALFGGGALVLRPDGSLLGMKLDLLAGTPFSTFFVPGLLLLVVIGGLNGAAALLALLGHARASLVGGAAGVSLMGWIAVQVQLLGYIHPLQPIIFTIGLLVLALSALVYGAGQGAGSPPRAGQGSGPARSAA